MQFPPPARREEIQDDYFGTPVADPYRWMEEWQGTEAQTFIAAQGVYSREFLDAIPERQELLERVTELRDVVPSVSNIQTVAGRSFYLRRDPSEDLARLVVRTTPDAAEIVLLDPNTIEGDAHTAIDWYAPSRDGRLVAYGISQGGSEDSVLHVLESPSGKGLGEEITRTQFSELIAWLDGGPPNPHGAFLYNWLPDLPPDTLPDEQYLDSRIYLHRVGTDPDGGVAVFGRGVNPSATMEPYDFPLVALPEESPWAIGLVIHGVLNELTIYAAPADRLLTDPAGTAWTKVADVEDGVVGLAVRGDEAYLLTHRDAPRYKVIAADLRSPDLAVARTVVPSGERVIEQVVLAGDTLVTLDLDAGVSRMRRFPLSGGDAAEVPLPTDGTIDGLTSEPGSSIVTFQLHSWITPPQISRYDAASGELRDTGWLPPSPVDLSDIEVTEAFAPAPDGARIPLTIIGPRRISRDGSNPVLLNGYGSYGINVGVRFLPQLLAWYERGGIFAIGRIRGGGEHGKEWHEAGRLLNKGNTIGDFIACGEYLIRQGYTSPARLAGEGTSAGGIPSGGAMVQRPDLWSAMIMRVAVTDALRMQYEPGGPPNIPEFGDSTTPEGFDALFLVSSYHRVQDGVAYPAVLLTTGLNDSRVTPWQGMKMVARLQAATSSGKPVLMRVEAQGGHGMGATARQLDEELADRLAFLLHAAGLSRATGS